MPDKTQRYQNQSIFLQILGESLVVWKPKDDIALGKLEPIEFYLTSLVRISQSEPKKIQFSFMSSLNYAAVADLVNEWQSMFVVFEFEAEETEKKAIDSILTQMKKASLELPEINRLSSTKMSISNSVITLSSTKATKYDQNKTEKSRVTSKEFDDFPFSSSSSSSSSYVSQSPLERKMSVVTERIVLNEISCPAIPKTRAPSKFVITVPPKPITPTEPQTKKTDPLNKSIDSRGFMSDEDEFWAPYSNSPIPKKINKYTTLSKQKQTKKFASAPKASIITPLGSKSSGGVTPRQSKENDKENLGQETAPTANVNNLGQKKMISRGGKKEAVKPVNYAEKVPEKAEESSVKKLNAISNAKESSSAEITTKDPLLTIQPKQKENESLQDAKTTENIQNNPPTPSDTLNSSSRSTRALQRMKRLDRNEMMARQKRAAELREEKARKKKKIEANEDKKEKNNRKEEEKDVSTTNNISLGAEGKNNESSTTKPNTQKAIQEKNKVLSVNSTTNKISKVSQQNDPSVLSINSKKKPLKNVVSKGFSPSIETVAQKNDNNVANEKNEQSLEQLSESGFKAAISSDPTSGSACPIEVTSHKVFEQVNSESEVPEKAVVGSIDVQKRQKMDNDMIAKKLHTEPLISHQLKKKSNEDGEATDVAITEDENDIEIPGTAPEENEREGDVIEALERPTINTNSDVTYSPIKEPILESSKSSLKSSSKPKEVLQKVPQAISAQKLSPAAAKVPTKNSSGLRSMIAKKLNASSTILSLGANRWKSFNNLDDLMSSKGIKTTLNNDKSLGNKQNVPKKNLEKNGTLYGQENVEETHNHHDNINDKNLPSLSFSAQGKVTRLTEIEGVAVISETPGLAPVSSSESASASTSVSAPLPVQESVSNLGKVPIATTKVQQEKPPQGDDDRENSNYITTNGNNKNNEVLNSVNNSGRDDSMNSDESITLITDMNELLPPSTRNERLREIDGRRVTTLVRSPWEAGPLTYEELKARMVEEMEDQREQFDGMLRVLTRQVVRKLEHLENRMIKDTEQFEEWFDEEKSKLDIKRNEWKAGVIDVESKIYQEIDLSRSSLQAWIYKNQ